MIEADIEIKRKIQFLYKQIKEIKKEINFRNIMLILNFIFYGIAYIYLGIILFEKIKNFTIYKIVIGIGFWISFIPEWVYSTLLSEECANLENKITEIENEIKNTENFNLYLISYRYIEALNQGKHIYKELYQTDCEYIINKYKDKYEQKRIEYEKEHIGFLKLNPYYLDEKLKEAPIESYSIKEQELLKQRQQEINNGIYRGRME